VSNSFVLLLCVLLFSPAARGAYGRLAPAPVRWAVSVARQPGSQEDCVSLFGLLTSLCVVLSP
jgi:hypothetical protein